jgi:FKBP-type peptidyl-prolyl cis-trans isomerase
MEKQKVLALVLPALAGSALLALILFLAFGSNPPEQQKQKLTDKELAEKMLREKGNGSIKESQKAKDMTSKGMSESLPSTENYADLGEGLKYLDVVEGEGDPAPGGCSVSAHYAGWLTNGSRFDSSYVAKPGGGSPLEFSLNQVVQGWTRGIPGMKPGGVRRLYIPSHLAYGSEGRPPQIPGNSPLVFEIKLIYWR